MQRMLSIDSTAHIWYANLPSGLQRAKKEICASRIIKRKKKKEIMITNSAYALYIYIYTVLKTPQTLLLCMYSTVQHSAQKQISPPQSQVVYIRGFVEHKERGLFIMEC